MPKRFPIARAAHARIGRAKTRRVSAVSRGRGSGIVLRTLTSRCGRLVCTVGTVVDVVAHQVVGDAVRQRLTFELSAIVDWNSNKKKKKTRFSSEFGVQRVIRFFK